ARFKEEQLDRRKTGVAALTGGAVQLPKPNGLLNRLDKNQVRDLQKKIDQLKAASPAAPPRAMVLNDLPRPTEPVVFVRGNPGNHGPKVPRQFLQTIPVRERVPYKQGSGRLELANDITSPKNPLTARVFVNRVWGFHFGQGFVSTPSDFGIRTEKPVHAELLDDLAFHFVNTDQWSIKALHRRIMLSQAYQQQSQWRPELISIDPENRLFARQNRQRRDFETLRDTMLQAAGSLDVSAIGGRSVDLFKTPFTNRRSVYALIDRQNLSPTLRAFDSPSPDQHNPQRFQTTVPQQSLFMMNSPFVLDQARALAARPELNTGPPREKVTRLFQRVLQRTPSGAELALAVDYLDFVGPPPPGQSLSRMGQLAQILLLSNEFLFVD
ncbi:MAG: DUF1553 domain-containing protein, partial [Gemmataceae bacterium]